MKNLSRLDFLKGVLCVLGVSHRLLALAAALSRGEDTPFENGPCSRA